MRSTWPLQDIFTKVGASWEKAKDELLKILGKGKGSVSTIERMLTMARDWDPVVGTHCGKWRWLKQGYIVGNDFMVGKGLNKKLRLSSPWAIAALELLKDKITMGAVKTEDKCTLHEPSAYYCYA